MRIHDGYIKCDQHGVVLNGVQAFVRDVEVEAGLAASNTYDAFQLNGPIDDGLRVEDNHIRNASQLRYGINIADSGVVRAIVVGNSGGDPADFGTDAINDQGTDTQLTYPSDATYGDNFFRSGSSSGADQNEAVSSSFDSAGKDQEFAQPVTPVQP